MALLPEATAPERKKKTEGKDVQYIFLLIEMSILEKFKGNPLFFGMLARRKMFKSFADVV